MLIEAMRLSAAEDMKLKDGNTLTGVNQSRYIAYQAKVALTLTRSLFSSGSMGKGFAHCD